MGYLELDTEYGEDDGLQMLREEVHKVAAEVVRPAALEIDRMDSDEYSALAERGSPYWTVMEQLKDLGYHRAVFPEEFGGDGISGPEFHVLMEELAWGSPGFAMALGVDLMPALFSVLTFDKDLEESFVRPYLEDSAAQFQGCWGVTEYGHGSEHVQAETLLTDGVQDGDPDAVGPPEVTIEQDGDEWIVDGLKASWLSAGPMATHVALHASMDPAGGDPGYLCLVDLDSEGVRVGDPIEKLGQRDCPQGEIAFTDVRIPDRNVIMTPDMLHPETGYIPLTQILCLTSAGVATASTGLARACFEEALAYAREREQGGKPICEHQSVKQQLYEMFEKVETCRAYSRTLVEHVWERNLEQFEFDASHRHALSAQVYCKRTAFEVAHQALQVHGASGITTDYPIEKLFRDARVKLVEDGTTEVLGLESATGVIENYEIA
jgi:alkylation response protein AidB-like acyl-CoA dehydrogenase